MAFSIRRPLVIVAAALFFAAGCEVTRRSGSNPLEPTTPPPPASSGGSMMGFWVAAEPAPGAARPTCGQFAWTVSSQTPDAVTGTFTAVCLESLVSGTASGTRSGDQVAITVTASALLGGAVPCDATIAGHGVIVNNEELHVEYVGQTCLGPLSGFEILRRPTPEAAPPPPPPVEPTPAPAPPPAEPAPVPPPTMPCAGLTEPYDILVCYRQTYGTPMSRDEHVDFLRSATRHFNQVGVPEGPFGLLRKLSGNNCNGYSCDIICAGQGTGQQQWDVLIDEEIPTWGSPLSGSIRVDVCEIQ
jgi:hypothetical protein